MKRNKYTIIFTVVLLCLTMAMLLVSCSFDEKIIDTSVGAGLFKQPSTTKVIGETKRKKPEVKDGGLTDYPSYTNTVKDIAQKQAISAENDSFFNYDKIDSYGNLYNAVKDDNGKIISYAQNGEKLYKHSGADGMYQESVEDSAQAVVAKVHIKPSRYGNDLAGLYVPSGEVVTVIIDDNLVAKGGLVVNIGFGVQRGGSVVIPSERDFTRFPSTRKTMTLRDNINYIGSPLGGSLYFMSEYLMNQDTNIEYDVTVIGAVESPQYYFGATSDAEWEKSRNAPGLFFHMEMRSGMRLTMPSVFARNKSAEEMRLLGQFYENTANISNKLAGAAWYSNHPVDCTFDSYVPAGAAVAFVGADFCCNPTSWAAGALDYYGMTTNGGWGVLHEFNHHHQGWGAGAGDEVTNNVANFLTYALNTNIGAYRRLGVYPDSWNWVADAYLSNKETKNQFDGGKLNRSLSIYVDLGHAFGEEFMYKLAHNTPVIRKRVDDKWVEDAAANMNQFYLQTSKISGYDMTYYLKIVNHFELSDEAVSEVKALNLPIYAPIASPYQTAIAMNGTDYIQLGKPYYVGIGSSEIIDFSNFIDMPHIIIDKITVEKLKVSGNLDRAADKNEYTYNYTPSANSDNVDEIIVTVDRQTADGLPIPTVKIKILLASDSAYVTGKLYENSGYADIDAIVAANFEGLEVVGTICNNSAAISTNVGNAVGVVEGKMLLPKGANTLIIRGDDRVKLVVTIGKKEYSAILNTNKGYDFADKDTIINIDSDGSPIAFKLYMLNKGGNGSANIGYVQSYNANGQPSIANIPSKFLRNINYTENSYDKSKVAQKAGNVGNYTATARQEDMGENASVTIAPQHYGNSVAQNMIDGNKQTFYHSKTGLAFPAEIVIDYGRAVKFNNINILPRRDVNNGAGRIKGYQLWAGNSPTDLTLIGEGEGANSYDGFDILTKITEARYVKIVVSSAWAQGYIAISEVAPSIALKSNAVVLSSSSYYKLSGNWVRNPYGSSLNGEVLYATAGKATIRFKGTAFAIMGNKDFDLGSAKVYVDGKAYGEMNCYATKAEYEKPLFIAVGLKDKFHDIEIKANGDNAINFNYMMFDIGENGFYANGVAVTVGTLPIAIKRIILSFSLAGGALIVIVVGAILITRRTKSNKKLNAKLGEVVLLDSGGGKELVTFEEEPTVMKPIVNKQQNKIAPVIIVNDIPMKPIKADEKAKIKPSAPIVSQKKDKILATTAGKQAEVKTAKVATQKAVEPTKKAIEPTAPKAVEPTKKLTEVQSATKSKTVKQVAPTATINARTVEEKQTVAKSNTAKVAAPKAVEPTKKLTEVQSATKSKTVKQAAPTATINARTVEEKQTVAKSKTAKVAAPKAVEPTKKATDVQSATKSKTVKQVAPTATINAQTVEEKQTVAKSKIVKQVEPKTTDKQGTVSVGAEMPKPILRNAKIKPTATARQVKPSENAKGKGGKDEKK